METTMGLNDRRRFLKAGGAGLALLALNGIDASLYGGRVFALEKPMKIDKNITLPPINQGKAIVLWYSQTENTARTGRCIGRCLETHGLSVKVADYRELKQEELSSFDLIVAGSPVYYYDVPSNFKQWLSTAPSLKGKRVAAFVTYGGEGGNQHNAACTLLSLLTDKGGAPVGLDAFGNMSTFAITWSTGNTKRILKYSHLPDGRSYERMCAFSGLLSENLKKGCAIEFRKNTDYREWIKGSPSIRGTKALITRHTIDKDRCVKCGKCERICPVAAIDIDKGTVDRPRCIACLGCVNNCPEQAVVMEFFYKTVTGFSTFKKTNNITFTEPETWVKGQGNRSHQG
jgi:ferredoxin/flavodoxin